MEGGRSGLLTWAQTEWLKNLPASGLSSYEDNMYRELDAGGLTPARAREAVRDVLVRHENLRSRAFFGRPDDPQVVDPVDDARLDAVIEFAPLQERSETVARARRTCFSVTSQWPVLFLFFTGPGSGVSRIGVVVDHWAADGWGAAILAADLRGAVQACALGRKYEGSGDVEQPIDLASWETQSPAGVAQLERSMTYWREQLTGLREQLGDQRRPLSCATPDGAERWFCGLWIRSGPLREDARRAARRFSVQESSLYLAAFGAAVCAVEQAPAASLLMLSANRLTTAARRSVRNAILQVPVLLPAGEGADPAALLPLAAARQYRAYKYANADPVLTGQLSADVLGALDGGALSDAKFNYMTEHLLGPGRLRTYAGDQENADGVPVSMEPRTQGPKYMLTVLEAAEGVELTLRWRSDTGWQQAAEPMLRYINDFVVHLARPDSAPPVFDM
jgi:hypothetical protein